MMLLHTSTRIITDSSIQQSSVESAASGCFCSFFCCCWRFGLCLGLALSSIFLSLFAHALHSIEHFYGWWLGKEVPILPVLSWNKRTPFSKQIDDFHLRDGGVSSLIWLGSPPLFVVSILLLHNPLWLDGCSVIASLEHSICVLQ